MDFCSIKLQIFCKVETLYCTVKLAAKTLQNVVHVWDMAGFLFTSVAEAFSVAGLTKHVGAFLNKVPSCDRVSTLECLMISYERSFK